MANGDYTNPQQIPYFQAPFTTFRDLNFDVSGGNRNPYFMPGNYNTNLFSSADEALKNDMFNITNTGGTVTGGFGVDLTSNAATTSGFNFKNMSAAQQMQVAGGIGGIIQGLVGRKKRRAAQRRAKKEYEKQRAAYQQLDTSNLAAGFKNPFANMENTYEDLTVNQQQAQFMAQQNQQGQANIMQGLRGAAGSSGIAGLAQIIANQSQLAAQKASASIGLQESQNQKLTAQGAAANQAAERKGEYQAQIQRLTGAKESRDLDWQKQEMELGFAMQEKTAADQAVQAANAALFGGIGSLATTALTGGFSPA